MTNMLKTTLNSILLFIQPIIANMGQDFLDAVKSLKLMVPCMHSHNLPKSPIRVINTDLERKCVHVFLSTHALANNWLILTTFAIILGLNLYKIHATRLINIVAYKAIK